jgi:hypothetical protein
MQIWILCSFTHWSTPKISKLCSLIILLANGLETFHKGCFSYQIQCSCQISRLACSGLQFLNFIYQHMVLLARATSHSIISNIWPGQMVKTQSGGGLILTQLAWALRRWALVQDWIHWMIMLLLRTGRKLLSLVSFIIYRQIFLLSHINTAYI